MTHSLILEIELSSLGVERMCSELIDSARGKRCFLAVLSAWHDSQERYSQSVSVTVSLAGAATSIIFVATNVFVATKYVFCRNKSMLVAKKPLLRQTYFCICHGELTFVATNTCLSQQNTSFVTTKVCLSRQTFCKIYFTSLLLSRQTRAPTRPRNIWNCDTCVVQ